MTNNVLLKLSIILISSELSPAQQALPALFDSAHDLAFEVIVCQPGISPDSREFIAKNYPQVRIVDAESGSPVARTYNAALSTAAGEYVLIFNPPAQISPACLAGLVDYADQHQEAGAFGCRIVNQDGSYCESARPFPSPWRDWLMALYLRPLGYFSDLFIADEYLKWAGNTEREVDWLSSCAMFRRGLLEHIGGMDEEFPYQYDDIDLCRRIWNAGFSILYTPEVTVTRLGTLAPNRYPVKLAIAKARSRYRYYYKHHGVRGAWQVRRIQLVALGIRYWGFVVKSWLRPSDTLKTRIAMLRTSLEWNRRLDPVRLVENGEEPDLDLIGVNA